MSYECFLASKAQYSEPSGFTPLWMPEALFDFQAHLVEWALWKGRAAMFADCGLGKTPMQLVWAENVARKTNRSVLILTPLAVATQTVAEASKFGMEATLSRDGKVPPGARIIVTNYEKLHLFSPHDFAGMVGDESGILKNFDGARKAAITEFMRTLPYRLLCTATAAPNDYIELGTHSEALGELGYTDMLSKFFKNDQRGVHANSVWGGSAWRFRGHAEANFWRWLCSWSRAARKPSDLGYADDRFTLPPLIQTEHVIEARSIQRGRLINTVAINREEQLEERRRTIPERCEKAASLIAATDAQAVAWCQLNDEGDLLTKLIPGAVQVSGSDPDERKEEVFAAFARGEVLRVVSKATIAGFGLNWQHCAHMTTFPSHSFEQFYQTVRRLWRFGQKLPVQVDMVASDGEAGVLANLQRKQVQADAIFSHLISHMQNALVIERTDPYQKKAQVPSWL